MLAVMKSGKKGVKAAPGFEPGNGGFADLCLTTWLCRQRSWDVPSRSQHSEAGDRTRTGDPNLGKVVLYQLSYTRMTRLALGHRYYSKFP